MSASDDDTDDELVEVLEDEFELSTLIRRLVSGLLVILAVAFVSGLVLRGPIEMLSGWFVGNFGLSGIFFGALALDSTPFTISEPLLLLGIEGDLGYLQVCGMASAASWCSGFTGWIIGKLLGQSAILQRMFDRYKIRPFMQRYGTAAVLIAALTPFPYAVATWSAGATDVPLWHVMLGAFGRIPKTFGYMGIVMLGYSGFG
jgi:membrane protein YqaA with SNARE-associated domain